jgi:hypothetical protein
MRQWILNPTRKCPRDENISDRQDEELKWAYQQKIWKLFLDLMKDGGKTIKKNKKEKGKKSDMN